MEAVPSQCHALPILLRPTWEIVKPVVQADKTKMGVASPLLPQDRRELWFRTSAWMLTLDDGPAVVPFTLHIASLRRLEDPLCISSAAFSVNFNQYPKSHDGTVTAKLTQGPPTCDGTGDAKDPVDELDYIDEETASSSLDSGESPKKKAKRN